MDYTASIEKGESGVGFGMVVVEDARKAQIIAKVRLLVCTFLLFFGSNFALQKVMNTIIMKNIANSSGGSINAGDQIVKIDGEDITTWTLMRGPAVITSSFSYFLIVCINVMMS